MAKWTVWNLKVFLHVGGNGHLKIEEDVRAFLRGVAKDKDVEIRDVKFTTAAGRGTFVHTAAVLYTTLERGRNLP